MEKVNESANCPYCLSPIEGNAERIRCPVCGVVHHAECWRTNGKCSVYGCDGWQAWSGAIADKIAPKIRGDIDIDGAETERSTSDVSAGPLCIDCGKPVRRGQLVCSSCKRGGLPGWLENCVGPSVIILGGLIAIVSLIVKGLN